MKFHVMLSPTAPCALERNHTGYLYSTSRQSYIHEAYAPFTKKLSFHETITPRTQKSAEGGSSLPRRIMLFLPMQFCCNLYFFLLIQNESEVRRSQQEHWLLPDLNPCSQIHGRPDQDLQEHEKSNHRKRSYLD